MVREGNIYPMTPGTSVRWRITGTDSDGRNWKTVLSCAVTGTERITVPAGIFDTYVVRCEDDWTVTEYRHAPALGANAARTKTDKATNRTETWVLMRYDPAA